MIMQTSVEIIIIVINLCLVNATTVLGNTFLFKGIFGGSIGFVYIYNIQRHIYCLPYADV